MGPKALNFIHSFARKYLTKGQGSGITKIPGRMEAEAKASEIASALVDAGLDFNKMDDFIRSEADVAKYLNILEAAKRERMRPIPADSPEGRQITEQLFGKRGEVVDMTGKKIDTRKGIMGGKSIEDLIESGQVNKGTVTKKSKKVTDREMFKAANERLTSDVNSIIKNIKSMEPITAMKEANSVIARKGKYKNLTPEQSKKILQDTEDHIFERDIPEEDFAKGGRAGFMAGGMGRRGFLKLLAGTGAGIAGLKSGLVNIMGKGTGKEVAKEVVQKSTTGSPPPYFFKLAEKIKKLGDDATATTDRTIAKTLKSKDGKSTYVLEEDVTSGDTIIKKINKEGDEMMTDVEIMELKKGEVVMGKDGRPVKVPDEYEEVTEVNARIEGDVFNDPYYSDGIKIDEIMKEVGEQAPSIKKADGGIMRAGYQMGGDVAYDATNQDIYGSSAATFTPDTVMDQFGNQVQAEMGNNYNKPLIPQVTEEAANGNAGGILPVMPLFDKDGFRLGDQRYGTGLVDGPKMALPESPMSGGPMQTPLPGAMRDMPSMPGNNNQMGILPVMPPKSENSPIDTKSILQDYGNSDFFSRISTADVRNFTFGGKEMSGSSTYIGGLRKYLDSIGKGDLLQLPEENSKSQQLAPNYGESPLASTVRTNMSSGGIARMLGE